ncbi:MAG: hypothetical protein A2289_16935 [Deltaproteobacteria bacterium RIFOXYA12_FULL_58_15]|nr:MAG: hypothetical protein A2289_16935 [Deltaproteobacteria bacterium RIFOXYA12_FULL_58_15]OGR09964.1 MAG: hypothetical protein A2341_12390 [Deltaproteobacteria bacterium RIFOXYB12_FULL_58_9]
MSRCNYSKDRLQAWLDDQSGKHSAQTRKHLEGCRDCANLIEVWRRAGEQLRDTVDQGLGNVEPLAALKKIRMRVAEIEQRSLGARMRAWWNDTWMFNRRALAGVAVAAALGALAAPGAVYLSGKLGTSAIGPALVARVGPGVVLESLEVGDNATAVVLDEGETTTLIWVEPGFDGSNEETF